VNRGAGAGQVTTQTGCPLMNQMQGVSDLYCLTSATRTDDHWHVQLFPASGGTPAGVIPADVKTEFDRLSSHIFNGEPGNPSSGRHIRSAWLATHAGAAPTAQNPITNILVFPVRPLPSFSDSCE